MQIIHSPQEVKVSNVYHISDVHIRLFKRHDEYKLVFNNLFSKLRSATTLKDSSKTSIAVVVGDILHSKTELTPECIQITKWFFTELGNILPTFVICGNHDTNLSNRNRLDSLTPILDSVQGVYYLNKSMHYRYGNVILGVTTVYDKNILPPIKKEETDCQIALFHGTVHGSMTDVGYRLTSKKFLTEHFKGYDLVMLGDIHKHQYLDDDKTIAYCSSLIQQNYGETLDSHGIIEWDLETKKPHFIEIENTYGYYTVPISDGEIKFDTTILREKPRIRFEIENTDPIKAKQLIGELCGKVNVQEALSYRVAKKQKTEQQAQTQDDLGFANVDLWLEKLVSDTETLEKVKQTHGIYSERVPVKDRPTTQEWQLKELDFSNMFCYNGKVEINLSDLKDYGQLVGILGPNHCGKSSIIDVILYCLFDKCSRGDRKEVVNYGANDFHCHLVLKIMDVQYHIYRTGKKNKKTVKVDVDFWKEFSDGTKQSLNGVDRYETNKKITQIIGTYEDLSVTNVSLQNESNSFIEMNQSNRKKLLNELLRLDYYEGLYTLSNNDLREMTAEIKILNKNHKIEHLSKFLDEINVNQGKIKLLESDINELNTQIKDCEKQRDMLLKKIVPIETDLEELDVQKIKHRLNILNGIMEQEIESLPDLEEILEEVQQEHDHDMEEWRQSAAKLREQIAHHKGRIRETTNVPYSKQALIKLKLKLENAAPTEFVRNETNFLQGIADELDEFEEDDVLLSIKNKLLERINNLNTYATNQSHNNKLTMEKVLRYLQELAQNEIVQETNKEHETQMSILSSKLHNLQKPSDGELKDTEQRIAVSRKQERDVEQASKEHTKLTAEYNSFSKISEQLENNKTIEKEVRVFKAQINGFKMKIEKKQHIINTLTSDISVSRQKISDLREVKVRLEKLTTEHDILKTYVNCMGKNGIPYLLLKETVPYLEQKVNEILSLMSDFTVEFNLDGKNIHIVLKRSKQQTNIDMASGFEKFICSTAIRVAMMNISLLPKPNFFIIDEGFGSFDADNLGNVTVLFDYLKANFDLIIVISHIDFLKNEVDHVLLPDDLKQQNTKLKPIMKPKVIHLPSTSPKKITVGIKKIQAGDVFKKRSKLTTIDMRKK